MHYMSYRAFNFSLITSYSKEKKYRSIVLIISSIQAELYMILQFKAEFEGELGEQSNLCMTMVQGIFEGKISGGTFLELAILVF